MAKANATSSATSLADIDSAEICRDCGAEVTPDLQSQHVQGLCNDCERHRIDTHPALLEAAELVISRRERGDPAGAVRQLNDAGPRASARC